MVDLQLYCSTLGSLQHLQHSHPEIAFVVNKLIQFNQPTLPHWHALCVLRYYSALHLGLSLHPTLVLCLLGFLM